MRPRKCHFWRSRVINANERTFYRVLQHNLHPTNENCQNGTCMDKICSCTIIAWQANRRKFLNIRNRLSYMQFSILCLNSTQWLEVSCVYSFSSAYIVERLTLSEYIVETIVQWPKFKSVCINRIRVYFEVERYCEYQQYDKFLLRWS